MGVMAYLCRIAVSLYPREFRTEFGDDLTASFNMHYEGLRGSGLSGTHVVVRQFADVWDIVRSALAQRFGGAKKGWGETETGTGYKIVKRMYFAWQCMEEAGFLEDMAIQGWEFIEYDLGWYWFKRVDVPERYEFRFERRFFPTSRATVGYLTAMEEKGWVFLKYWLGWFYFKRRAGGGGGTASVPAPVERYRIVPKLYFAWQVFQEADFLTAMSGEGWHFVEYTLGHYWFRRLPEPEPYEFRFERRNFVDAGAAVEYLDEMSEKGWEFHMWWLAWHYFRRPLVKGDGVA